MKVFTLFLLFFFFFFVYCVVLYLKVYWKAYLALFQPLDLEKKNTNTAVRVKIIISLLRVVVVQNWYFDLSAWNLTGKLINLFFPRWITNSKLDSRRKRQGFQDKKQNWNALLRTYGAMDISVAVRRTENCSCISIFAHILKLLAQIDSMFSAKYFCSQYF